AGLSESYVSKVEKGGVVPSIEAFAAIVHTLGLNASEVALLLSLLVKHDDEGTCE
ncbi:MAG: helix-turn-helix transcriptional regulator, partial [Candidatus Saccharibacteria bacterium]|nr:helix-turn-helix transcriptional regulator [Candidatus Saccharibacteria bacterium]